MFDVDGIQILSDEIELLCTLRDELLIQGNDLFGNFKESGTNIQFKCPFHNNGQEMKPSCGISTIPKHLDNGNVIRAGTVHCFTCGYTAGIGEFISNCFGYNDSGYFGKKWLIKNFISIEPESRKPLELVFRRKTRPEPIKSYVSAEELDSYRYYHGYMYKRKLTNELINIFDVGFDGNFILRDKKGEAKAHMQCLTFPVRDEIGGTLFIARRAIHGKFFHYPENVNKPVYGIYELQKYWKKEKTSIIVCESILNAITCWKYGMPAVALLGLGTQAQYNILSKLDVREYILGFDPDKAGLQASEKFRKNVKNKFITRFELPEGKDLNDLEEEEFKNLKKILN